MNMNDTPLGGHGFRPTSSPESAFLDMPSATPAPRKKPRQPAVIVIREQAPQDFGSELARGVGFGLGLGIGLAAAAGLAFVIYTAQQSEQ